jgi:hypothetical protein
MVVLLLGLCNINIDTIRLMFVLSLPQIILRVFQASYFDTNNEIEYDDTEQNGRHAYQCNVNSNRRPLLLLLRQERRK